MTFLTVTYPRPRTPEPEPSDEPVTTQLESNVVTQSSRKEKFIYRGAERGGQTEDPSQTYGKQTTYGMRAAWRLEQDLPV